MYEYTIHSNEETLTTRPTRRTTMSSSMSRRRRGHDRNDVEVVVPSESSRLAADSPIRRKQRSPLGQLKFQMRLKTASLTQSANSRLPLALLLVGFLGFVAFQWMNPITSFVSSPVPETPNLLLRVVPKKDRIIDPDDEGNGFYAPESNYFTKRKDYGGLEFESLNDVKAGDFKRSVGPRTSFEHHDDRLRHLEEEEEEEGECQPVDWRADVYNNCNMFHELILDGVFLGRGTFRDAWLLYPNGPHETSAVLKVLQVMSDDQHTHRVNIDSVEQVRLDALIMERLTGSPRIVDIYGYCAVSIVSESMPGEVVYDIVPGEGHPEEDEEVPLCSNELTSEEKLDIALIMSEAIADLHGFPGGIIVHSDVHPEQWLRSPDGTQIKLNDFNNAEILEWEEEEEHYCEVDREAWNGMYRSPEEFLGTPIDEKIDVFSMGHNIYTLLTGLWPYYDEWDYDAIQDRVRDGELPFVDPRIPKIGYIEARLVEIMQRMWAFESEDRPDIFTVVEFLQETKDFADKLDENEASLNHTQRRLGHPGE